MEVILAEASGVRLRAHEWPGAMVVNTAEGQRLGPAHRLPGLSLPTGGVGGGLLTYEGMLWLLRQIRGGGFWNMLQYLPVNSKGLSIQLWVYYYYKCDAFSHTAMRSLSYISAAGEPH